VSRGREAGEDLPGRGAAGGREKERDARERGRTEREEREKGFPKDLCANLENCRDLSVKHNFSLIENPNEEMPKMKVGEFFKLYNIALGLKFKNSKLISLHVKFCTKVGFELLLSQECNCTTFRT
jgi:hypothetical protein